MEHNRGSAQPLGETAPSTATSAAGGISFEEFRAIALLVFAYSLFHGWTDLFFIGEVISLPAPDCNTHQLFIFSRTLGFAGCLALSFRVTTLITKRAPFVAVAALLLAGSALMLFSALVPSWATGLQACGSIVGGIGVGFVSVIWFELVCRFRPLGALICYLLSVLVSPALITPLYAASFEGLAFFSLIAPLLTASALVISLRFEPRAKHQTQLPLERSLLGRTVALLSLFGFALAFREPIIGNQLFASGSYTAIGSVVMAFAVLLGWAVAGNRFRISFLCRIMLPLTAAAFLLLPSQFPILSYVSDFCGSASDELVKILAVVVITHLCWQGVRGPLYLFALAYSIHGAFVFVGGEACLALMGLGISGADLSAWFSIIAALAIAATIFVLPSDQQLATIALYEEGLASLASCEAGCSLRRAQVLIREYSLTARESEILMLMLDGKSVDEIASKLIISRETAKTHRRNIFQKCGTRSEEELLRLAEGLRGVEGRGAAAPALYQQ